MKIEMSDRIASLRPDLAATDIRVLFGEFARATAYPPAVAEWCINDFIKRYPWDRVIEKLPPLEIAVPAELQAQERYLCILVSAAAEMAALQHAAQRTALLGVLMVLEIDLYKSKFGDFSGRA